MSAPEPNPNPDTIDGQIERAWWEHDQAANQAPSVVPYTNLLNPS